MKNTILRLKEWIAHTAFNLRIAKQTAVYYQNNKPSEVYIIWGKMVK